MTLRGLPRPGESGPRIFGEPYETPDGTTVITVTSPPGVFAIREGQAKWEPAVDATRVALVLSGELNRLLPLRTLTGHVSHRT